MFLEIHLIFAFTLQNNCPSHLTNKEDTNHETGASNPVGKLYLPSAAFGNNQARWEYQQSDSFERPAYYEAIPSEFRERDHLASQHCV
jgi:hypothetical protein